MAALLGAGALAAGACNIVGPAVGLMADEKVQAAYALDPKRPTVIFIDDRASALPSKMVRQRLAKAAEGALLEAKVLDADLISSDALVAAVAAERFGKPRSIADLGQAVGAEVVIYAAVDAFSLSRDGQEYSPTAVLRVKVIDAKDAKRLWPEDERTAVPLTISPPVRTGTMPKTASDRAQAEGELAEVAGKSLAKLFFKHSVHEANPRVGSAGAPLSGR
jgi:hypothetical protein